ncbi:MAG: hypothetical protein KAR83_08885 [Thermodesulfovibrionales bacterium]|nr:hypothetical protein [Thermodesulfovibrionales bacterium]
MNKTLSKITYFLTPYAFALSIIYLLSFWSSFNINILEFLSLSDIIISSLYPLLYGAVFFTIGAVIGEIATGPLPAGGGADTEAAHYLRMYFKYVIIAMILGAFYLMLFTEFNNKFIIGGILLTWSIYFNVKQHGIIEDLIPNDRVRSVILFLLIFMPFFAFAKGKDDSKNILEGNVGYYVDVKVFDGKLNFNGQNKLKYVGKKGNYIFLLSDDNNKLYVSRFPEDFVLELERQTIKKDLEIEIKRKDASLINTRAVKGNNK